MSLSQKLWWGKDLNDWNREKVLAAIEQTGRKLPCTVVSASTGFVTIKFQVVSGFNLPQITIPVTDPQYIRVPYQPGDAGFCVAADAQIGPISGQGGLAPTLTAPPNLSALAFQPCGNEGWTEVPGNVLVLYGPQGVTIIDQAGNSFVEVTPTAVNISGKQTVAVNAVTSLAATVGTTSVTLTPILLQLQVASPVGLTINGVPGFTGTFPIPGGTVTVDNGIVVSAT